jgi:hypothetical protein
MLTRIGSSPGPEWMRRIEDASGDPRQFRELFSKLLKRLFIFFGILQMGSIVIADIAVYRAHGHHLKEYHSQAKIRDLPMLAVGPTAHGVIAYGGVATGVIAMGGVAVGVIAFGATSVGIFAVGGLSLGVLALAGFAIGWRALGGMAIGNAALGGLAIGRYAYAGLGVAFGRDEASGKQKETLFG